MRKYEAMFILRPDLNDGEKTTIFDQIKNTLLKSNAKISSADIWVAKRRLFFELALKGESIKFKEGLYYLVEFESEPLEIKKIDSAYRLNENILRFLITSKEK